LSLASLQVAPVRPAHARHWLDSRGFALLFPLTAFLVTRLVVAFYVAVASKHQVALTADTFPGMFIFHPSSADPGYGRIVSNWDGQWYQSIATNGYHVTRPGEVATHANVWAWAFPPAYPLLVGLLMDVTGFPFGAAASLVSCVAGAAAMMLLFHLLESTGGRGLATCGVILAACFVSAPLLQAAYSESLALLFVLWAVCLIRRRNYWLAIVPTGTLAFTRLIAPVLCVVVVVAIVDRVRTSGWSSVPARHRAGAVALMACGALGGFAWPALAAHLMGEAGRFNRTSQLAFGSRIGWFGEAWSELGWPGLVSVSLLLAVPLLGAFTTRSRQWGIELRTWSAAYPAYILVLTPITGGVLRYMVLAPTLGLLWLGPVRKGKPSHRQFLIVMAAAVCGLSCQWLYVRYMMVIDAHPFML
jgi:hypothetical protein